MKNFKSSLFVLSAAAAAGLLAALLSGCDGSGVGGSVNGDAGRDDVEPASKTDAGRPDVVKSSDARATSCQVPEPKYSLNGLVTSKPRGGYRTVDAEDVQCTSLNPGGGQPTNCADPVDGFAKTTSDYWCCMVTQKVNDAYYVISPIMMCGSTVSDYTSSKVPAPVTSDYIPGHVALCSPTGKFLGWGCS